MVLYLIHVFQATLYIVNNFVYQCTHYEENILKISCVHSFVFNAVKNAYSLVIDNTVAMSISVDRT